MVLMGFQEDGKWIQSSWNLTHRIGWDQICKGVSGVFDYYDRLEVLIDNQRVNVESSKDVLELSEAGSLTFRGVSTIIQVPLMITFINQTNTVNVAVACMTDEFRNTTYERLSKSLGQYLDSIELLMYR